MGQIDGVPTNPRKITKDKFELLKSSIQQDITYQYINELKVFPLEDKFVVLSGNQRLRAYKQLKIKECYCKIIKTTTSPEALRKIVLAENHTYGEDDHDELANSWDMTELESFGYDLPVMDEFNDENITEPTAEVLGDDDYYLKVESEKKLELMELSKELQNRGYSVRVSS